MREIKFRAWDKDKKEMFFPETDNNSDSFWCGFEGDKGIRAVAPDESNYPLMQYTGLKDKNGKELYEGDVIEGEDSIWGKFHSDVRWVTWGFRCHDARSDSYNFMPSEFEIIGNIYSNPELLTETK